MNLSFDRRGNTYRRNYTKHYYAGSQRISGALGSSVAVGDFNCNWLIIPFGSGDAPINEKDVALQKAQAAADHASAILQQFGINGIDYGQNAGYDEECTTDFSGIEETDVYWYHPDHLGSSSFITGIDGEVNQNIEYFPSGETFVENHLNSYNVPYKFNSKELDDETGYYYYGARYYNPRTSLWLNVDPLAEKYPSISPYAYVANNPINAIDPDGRDIIYLNGNGTINRVVNNGSNYITVVGADGKGRLLGSLNVSRGLTNWNNENRQIVANVVAYYGGKIGAKEFTSTYERSESSVAYYSSGDGRITVNPQSNGYLHPTLNNKYDLMNVLYHENRHKYDDKNNNEASTFFSHANVAYQTINHWTFKKSSEIHQQGEVGYFSALIMNSYYQENNDKADALINQFNSSNSGYKLNFIKHKGIMEITMPNGKTGQVKYEKSNSAPNLK